MTTLNAKKCSCPYCLHKERTIDDEPDEFIKSKNLYFHKDCYQTEKAVQYIYNLWKQYIDKNVIRSQLNNVLYKIIFKENVTSDFLVFVIKYCIRHDEVKLRHPPGLWYVVESQVIKDAYKRRKIKTIPQSAFKVCEDDIESPKFTVKKEKMGFENILRKH